MVTMRSGQAAQAALREEHWQEMERFGDFLTDEDLAALPQTIRDGLIGVRRPGGMRYPAFQIVNWGDGTKEVPPAWLQLVELLAPAGWNDEFLILWTSAPNAYLEGASPAQTIQSFPTEVTAELRYAAERAIPTRPGGPGSWQ
ncbi:hypothetical protein SAMN05192575_101939 [Nocardioides alpinus]|uniref:Uncharacterized protein n=2 Tax=Nocardioides alpinus TaxID=748909 RepID=A0A1I0WE24_9ACTN|nr:hypothetical protein [Nocardioides alpinus]SFA86972.1 hypothetical protein SAMN05192575_101939 [Nocardioides alpinus]